MGSLGRNWQTKLAIFCHFRLPVRLWFAWAELADSPLKDEKTTFSAFIPFQATFPSMSFSPQI
jgi:hypothetical protein